MQYPPTPHVPVDETQVSAFLAKNPAYDGRGTLIAVVDSGIDPLAHGLQVTSDGKRKVVDYIDCSGAGDVAMSNPMKAADGTLPGATGRTLKLNPQWLNPTDTWRVGMKRMFDITPIEVLPKIMRARETVLKRDVMRLKNDVAARLDDSEAGDNRKELEVQRDMLDVFDRQYCDFGPVFDCVVFHDGEQWRAAIDTSETGDLSEAEALGAYKLTGQVGMLSRRFLVPYTLNFYDQGQILSIVTCSIDHGTGVAGILAAYDPDNAQNNGVAPGAQLVSIQVGGYRQNGNIPILSRTLALKTLVDYNVNLMVTSIISYVSEPNFGHNIDLINQHIIRKHRCIAVAAIGNDGPALSTVMSPGGTTDWIIGAGAYYTPEQIKDLYAMCSDAGEAAFNFSSRGPATDGSRGVDIYAPGCAITTNPAYIGSRKDIVQGTSHAAPNLCGCLALLVSAWKQEVDKGAGNKVSPFRIRNAIMATARQFGDDLGVGLVQTTDAWEFLKKHAGRASEDVFFEFRISMPGDAHGIYLRDLEDSATPRELSVAVQAVHIDDPLAELDNDMDEAYAEETLKRVYSFDMRVALLATAKWVKVPASLYVSSGISLFDICVDATGLQAGRLHTAEIQGFDAQNVERGPIFSIPIVVTKPLTVGPSGRIRFDGLQFKPEEVVRRFIAVPKGATKATITLHSPNKSTHAARPAKFKVNCVQLIPMSSFKHSQLNSYHRVGHTSFAMSGESAEQSYSRTMVVRGYQTIEICVSPHWGSHNTYELNVSVEFRGLVVAGSLTHINCSFRMSPGIMLSGDVPVNRVDLQALVSTEDKITPAGYFDKLQRFFWPTKSTISVLRSERDLCLATKCPYYQLVLDYSVSTYRDSIGANVAVTGLLAASDDLWAMGVTLLAFDARKKCIARMAGVTGRVFLPRRGDYTFQLQIRHLNTKDLEAMRRMNLSVVFDLGLRLSIQIRPSVAAVFDRRFIARYVNSTIPTGKQLPFFFDTATFKAPPEAQPGDVLVGILVPKPGLPYLALNYAVPPPATTRNGNASQLATNMPTPSSTNGSLADKERRELSEALVQMRIGWVKKVKDEGVREQLIEELVSEHSELSDLDRMSVLVAQLELLDTQRHVLPHEASSGITEASAAKIIKAADKLAALVDTSNLAIVLSNRQSASVVSEDEARARRDAAKSRNMLASALTSKCRALAFQVSADSSSDALKEYESAVAQLAKWSDTSSNPVPDITHLFAAVIPLHMCKSEYAQALMALSMWTKLAPMTRANAAGWKTVAVLQIQLLAKLGWSAWADNFKNRLFEECPGVRVPS